jgi:hypothetical protein
MQIGRHVTESGGKGADKENRIEHGLTQLGGEVLS